MPGHASRAPRGPRGAASLVIPLALLLVACTTSLGLASSPILDPPNDRTSTPVDALHAQRDAWRADWRDLCITPSADRETWIAPSATPGQREALGLVHFVARDETFGAPLLAAAREQGIAICLLRHERQGARGIYDARLQVIAVDRDLDDFDAAIILAHELRHADVIARGVEPSLTFAMRDAITVHLAMEADAHLVGILYAWHAAQDGKPGLWSAALALTQHDDVARVVGAGLAAGVDPRHCYREAFGAWFSNQDRVDTYRFYAAMAYVDKQDAQHALPGCDCVPPVTYEMLGVLPNGKAYDARPPDIW